MVGAEAAQAVLDGAHDPAARAASMVALVAHLVEELGGEHDVVAPALERPADDLLALAAAVDVGGVDEVDAGIERAVDHAHALVVVAVAHLPEHHRPEALGADLDARSSQLPVSHRGAPHPSSIAAGGTYRCHLVWRRSVRGHGSHVVGSCDRGGRPP